MHAFAVLSDPVRRRILELLADGEMTSGAIGVTVQEEFGISQPGASQHLRVLRDHGVVQVRAEGARRIYALNAGGLTELDRWLDQFRRTWDQPLDALETELARGQRDRRRDGRQTRGSRARPA